MEEVDRVINLPLVVND